MNFLDVFILIPIVWFWIRGISKGLIIELATLAGMVLGILGAYYFASYGQDLLREYFSFSEHTARVVSYIVIFLVIWIVIYLIGRAIDKSVDLMAMGWFNKILGGIFGLAKGVLIVCLVLLLIEKTDPNSKVIKPNVKEKSFLYEPLMKMVHTIIPQHGNPG